MNHVDTISFEIISTVGMARSLYIEAIHSAKAGNFTEAQEKISEGQEYFTQGHKAHFGLIQQEADEEQEPVKINLILMHAEDQLMSAEAFGILAQEFVDLYQLINEKD